jgi:hypothetical protein
MTMGCRAVNNFILIMLFEDYLTKKLLTQFSSEKLPSFCLKYWVTDDYIF